MLVGVIKNLVITRAFIEVLSYYVQVNFLRARFKVKPLQDLS